MAKKEPPKWESDEEYMEWARGEAAKVRIEPIPYEREWNVARGRVYDPYNGCRDEDEG